MSLFNQCIKKLLLAVPVIGLGVSANNITGPSSSQPPYLVRSRPGVVTVSLLTVGDSVNFKSDGVTPYRMVGIPDGLGAFDNGDGTFTVLMNHELPGNGITRDHGFRGSFVSKWIIHKESFTVLHGEDLIKHAFRWSTVSNTWAPLTAPISRLCSADLPALSAFYNGATAKGYNGRIFLNGEESGSEGRAWGHLLNGDSYELPRLGKFSWENAVAHPNAGDKTVVVGLDDSTPGQVYVYAGDKQTSGGPIDQAGLNNGILFGIKVIGFTNEPATGIPSGTPFTAFNLGNLSSNTGQFLERHSNTNGVTQFNRPEDGAWDPQHPHDFYFVTTANFAGNSRLWRLRFTNPANPALGGTIDMLLDGSEGQKMMDNITVSRRGSVFIQEDIGGQDQLGKVWRYSIAKDKLELVAEHESAFFDPLSPLFLTRDEESSGIIPMDEILGSGWYLLDVQAHYNAGDVELVEGGQLLLMHFPPGQEKK